MNSTIFEDWLKVFANQVKVRPVLIVLDGHLSHVSLSIIQFGIEQKIIIVKFPPHVTDVLQPLDLTCFSSLKTKWNSRLSSNLQTQGTSCDTSKNRDFVHNLCAVWPQALTKENIISGFRKSGIFPVDRTKYPLSRFDKRVLLRYQEWEKLGKPDDKLSDLAYSPETPTKMKAARKALFDSLSASSPKEPCPNCMNAPEKPSVDVPGFTWYLQMQWSLKPNEPRKMQF